MDKFTRKKTDIYSSNLSKKLLLISQELSYIPGLELLDLMSIVTSRVDYVSIELKISYMHLLIAHTRHFYLFQIKYLWLMVDCMMKKTVTT